MVKPARLEGANVVHRRHLTPCLFHDTRRRTVGLIGGSFNPAHDGHLHMAELARKTLGLDEIWWMVTPQKPAETVGGYGPSKAPVGACPQICRQEELYQGDCSRIRITQQLYSQHTDFTTKSCAQNKFFLDYGS